MDSLQRIVLQAAGHSQVTPFLERQVQGILNALKLEASAAEVLSLSIRAGADLSEIEMNLHQHLRKKGFNTETLAREMDRRATLTLTQLLPHLGFGRLLDLGGGSGEIAERLHTEQGVPEIVIADVRDWRVNDDIPFTKVEGNRIAHADDNAFDQVQVLTVYHHSDDPEMLISETFRVARQRVVIIESVTDTLMEFLYGAWIDWFYNRVIHFSEDPDQKVPVPCRFLPATGWEQAILRLTGHTPAISQDLGIYQFLNPERHHLFVYELY